MPEGPASTGTSPTKDTSPAVRRSATAPEPGALGSRSGASHYAFTDSGPNGVPARWSSCQPVRLVVNPAGAPSGAVDDLTLAVAQVKAATGLNMVITGRTSAKSVPDWGAHQRAGYSGWAPVLVSWGHPGGALNAGASATTEPIFRTNSSGQHVIVSAQLRINVEHDDYYTHGLGGQASRVALYMHELGHVVGLEHVDDPHQLMYPAMGHARDFGAGDLAGLRKAGQGGCMQVPAAPWK
jgi:hypothetical protein